MSCLCPKINALGILRTQQVFMYFEFINGVFMFKSLALRWGFESEMSMFPV